MRKIRLTERDLITIIRRVVNETETPRPTDLDWDKSHGGGESSGRRGPGRGKLKMAAAPATPAAAPPPCPPLGPTSGPGASPFYTNYAEFCYMKDGVYHHQQPGMSYYGHPDGACC
tara:strand:- start:4907 stop:5254 length:348 start_codon:yes stop_codon:yes gene_type:complete